MAPRSPAPPPDYFASSPYPQPPSSSKYPNPPSFRKRKSSTIISLIPSAPLEGMTAATSTSPAQSTSALPAVPGTEANQPHPSAPQSAASPTPIPPYLNELERRISDSSSAAEEGEATPLLGDEEIKRKWFEAPLFVAGVKLSLLFMVFTAVVVGTFWFGLPKLEPEDKAVLKLPRSFADLQSLNNLFQKYKREYPTSILACGVVTYLFVQTFTLPGSMYLSIVFGAAYGIMKGLLLACLCDATGSALCYTLSSIVAPPLLEIPFYRARVETWRVKIMGDPKKGKQVSLGDVFAFLVVLRIAPFPPHWIPNFVAPHLGISLGLFWLSCFIGIAPVSVIHVTIGSSLDTMTSAADFHLLSLRNVLGLIAVVVAVLIPVGLKRVFRKDLGELGEAEAVIEEAAIDDPTIDVPTVEEGEYRRYQAIDSGVVLAGPSRGDDNLDTGIVKGKGKGRQLHIIADIDEEDETYDVYDSRSGEAEVACAKTEKRIGGRMKGYGAIEPVEREIVAEQPASWWPFAR